MHFNSTEGSFPFFGSRTVVFQDCSFSVGASFSQTLGGERGERRAAIHSWAMSGHSVLGFAHNTTKRAKFQTMRIFPHRSFLTASLLFALLLLLSGAPATNALNGESSKLSLDGLGGWKTFEVVTQGDSNGNGYVVPGEIDGMGAFLADGDTLRVLANHETGRACDAENEATVTEVDLDLSNFQTALRNMITSNSLNGEQSFVRRFRRAYDRIVDANGQEVQSLSRSLRLFCSSQAYGPDTFGDGEGFRDQIYIVGEEQKDPPYGRLFAIDSASGKMYQVTDRTGDASGSQGGVGGMMWDSFENIALIRTFEKNHVAFLIGVDGGSGMLKLYVGQKNKGTNGQADSTDFLARNGLVRAGTAARSKKTIDTFSPSISCISRVHRPMGAGSILEGLFRLWRMKPIPDSFSPVRQMF